MDINNQINFFKSKEKILDHFNKFPNIKCGSCGSRNLTLLEGFFNKEIHENISSDFIIGGVPRVPTVGLVCTSCGHLMEYSAGFIGLLPNEQKNVSHKTNH